MIQNPPIHNIITLMVLFFEYIPKMIKPAVSKIITGNMPIIYNSLQFRIDGFFNGNIPYNTPTCNQIDRKKAINKIPVNALKNLIFLT